MLSDAFERNVFRVLLVDDDQDYLSWAERTWARLGYHLESCRSVDEARKQLLVHTYDGVVSDSVVSRTTRTNALTIAAQVTPGIPRVLVSGKDEVEVEQMAAAWRATAWLTKPFDYDALARALRQKPSEDPTRGFVWRESSLVFVVGPPRDSWPVAQRLIDEVDGDGVAVVVVDGGHTSESLAFAEHLLGREGPLQAIGFASTEPDARRRWSLLKPGNRVVTRAFADLTQAVEWTAVRANMATTLYPRAAPFVDAPDASRPRVLVVDDDPPIRLLVGRFLTKLGAEVLTACNVDEAEELLADGPVDAAIIDKNMPGRSGMELLRKLETEAIGVATVMMTADPTEATREEATGLGALAYLEKPFALSELEHALSSALRGAILGGDSGRLEAVTEMLREMSAWARRRRE